MFNRRTFLQGLGTGIIIGAILLQLFNLGQDSQENLKNIGEQLENVELEPSGDESKSGQQNQEDAEQEPELTSEPTPEADAGSEAENSDNAAESSSETGEAALGALRLIRIEPGMSLEEISVILTDNRIIDSQEASAFVNKMVADKKLARAGYYAMPVGFGVEAVIEAVVSQPLSKEEAERKISTQS